MQRLCKVFYCYIYYSKNKKRIPKKFFSYFFLSLIYGCYMILNFSCFHFYI
nr:MAG TPA: hypothetical protein [Caudoviricetes sp.]